VAGWPAICLVLAVVTVAVYWPATRGEFLNFDDGYYFSNNPHVQSGLSWDNIRWAFTTGYAANWHPLTWLSLMLDVELFGRGPFGPHATNLLWHAANTVLLFLLLRRWKLGDGPSALAAGLFALHPLHVESVAWVSERKDVLSAFFGLLSLMMYTDYAEEYRVHGSRCKACYCLALFFYMLGLMSKPMLVTLPLVMLLLDYWPLGRCSGFTVLGSGSAPSLQRFNSSTLKGLLVEKIPFLVMTLVSCVITYEAQQRGGTVIPLSHFSFAERVGNAFVSYARYLEKALWPVVLADPYPHPGRWPVAQVLSAAGLMLLLCVLAVAWRRRCPFVLVGWFWFVGMLIPVIGLVQVGDAALADRYTYLPLIGLFLILAAGIGTLSTKRAGSRAWASLGVAALLVACGWRTRLQLAYWQNSEALFHHTLAVTDHNYAAYNNLGTWLAHHKVFPEAIDCFQASLRCKPDVPDTLYNLGNAYGRLNQWDEAIDCYRHALQITPNQAEIMNNLGLALTARGQMAEAVTNFEAALRLNPNYASAHNNLATVLFMEHRFDESAQHFRAALQFMPDDPRVHANLGDALAKLGQIPEAAKCYREALRLDPGNPAMEAKLKALDAEERK
jgi:Flp pilus assembly protein TadD